MNFKCFKISNLFFIAIVVFFLACEKELCYVEPTPESQGLSVINGYLVFENNESFFKTTDFIANLSDNEREKWESEIGFKSQRRIISNIIAQECVIDSINEIIYANGSDAMLADEELHSDEYWTALNNGVIRVFDEGTEDEYWDFSVFNRGFIDFINKDGLFAIGDTLYHVTDKSLKAMKPADLNKPELLLSATSADEKNNIFILHQETNLKAASPGLIESSWVNSGGGKKGEKRIKIGIYLAVKYYVSSGQGSGSYDFFHEVYVQCQERNWLRQWKYQFTNINVNGSWGVSVFYIPQLYENSWSWNGSASYLKASINPQTGSSASYQSYFHVNPNDANMAYGEAWQYNYQPIFDSYNWSATRNGGCCGLTARLTK